MAAEFQKGEVSGFYQTFSLLDFTIESLEQEIAKRKHEELDNV